MQRRYCQCGYAFFVAYEITKGGVRHFVRVQCKKSTASRCPACGRKIDINELR